MEPYRVEIDNDYVSPYGATGILDRKVARVRLWLTAPEGVRMDDIDTAKLLARLLAVMGECWLELFVSQLEGIVNETGNGREEVEIYKAHVVQMNKVIKAKR